MSRICTLVFVLFAAGAGMAQTPAGTQAGAGQKPGTITLTLADALARAKVNSPQFQTALTQLGLAREDKLQARAALLPGVDYNNSFIYTQGNGLASGRYIGNNGVHEYISQGIAHEDIGIAQIAEYQRTAAAHALAKARAEIALRGLTVTVVQDYYGYLAAQNKAITALQQYEEGRHFLELSQKLEAGGEVAHSDVIKAQIQANDLQRARDQARLDELNARLALAVLLFPNFFQDFTLANDVATVPPLPALTDLEQLAGKNNPELQAALSALQLSQRALTAAKAGYLPSLSLNSFYGIDANQFATRDRNGFENLGYAASATLNIPVWNWGATQSRIRQAQLERRQAQVELSAAQRQAIADLQSFYAEAETARTHLDLLKSTADAAADSLRLTYLRYQAGEATALEVVDAQNTLTQARNALDDGQTRYRVALANLQTLTGPF